jgi:hypothetical protein
MSRCGRSAGMAAARVRWPAHLVVMLAVAALLTGCQGKTSSPGSSALSPTRSSSPPVVTTGSPTTGTTALPAGGTSTTSSGPTTTRSSTTTSLPSTTTTAYRTTTTGSQNLGEVFQSLVQREAPGANDLTVVRYRVIDSWGAAVCQAFNGGETALALLRKSGSDWTVVTVGTALGPQAAADLGAPSGIVDWVRQNYSTQG